MILKSSPLVITIDGTSSSGKGTISKKLSQKLGWHLLDSGILYRGLALLYIYYAYYIIIRKSRSIDIVNFELYIKELNYLDINLQEEVLLNLARDMTVKFSCLNNHEQCQINYQGENLEVTKIIRNEFFANLASRLAVMPEIRVALLQQQRKYLQAPGLVADGRDLGTIIFPEAILKFFLDADPKVRATRRYIQLKQIGVNGKLHNRIEELSERDLRDSQRMAAPLKPAADAIIIDTTTMTINEVFDAVMCQVNMVV